MKNGKLERRHLETDVLIIGGGTAGCYAAIRFGAEKDLRVLVVEKANIERSGCLAAGVNALNAYISNGHTPADYVEYARRDAEGIIRDDLMMTIAESVNAVTEDLERRGLVILKDAEGHYVTRGWRNVKINGENIKPLLAKGVREQENVTVLNHVNITDLKVTDGAVHGAWGFSVRERTAYDIEAKAVLIATGGAAGLYRPNNPGFSRHKMWYPPFNTGAGYAMGIRAGAEMTTLEHRFVALRCKDTIAPTGTIAQGVGAKQVNAKGEVYETKYGLTTPQRIFGTVEENRKGNGPCYLDTRHITAEQQSDLYHAYLNMAPAQTLKWIESGKGPKEQPVEVEGTEPYVVGGHTASGFWVDTNRETTIHGLFAAGDVAGGAPQKYVTGALAEGEIAADALAAYLATKQDKPAPGTAVKDEGEVYEAYEAYLSREPGNLTVEQLEEAMQKTMDEYAGGIHTDYRYNASRLKLADEKIQHIETLLPQLAAEGPYELLKIYELRERLTVCRALIAHLLARKETRWHTFGENADYPQQSEDGLCYINSRLEHGAFHIYRRPLVKGGHYEHTRP
ncbi:adenylyl-sulfate reductase subunit alpha [Mitsuokella multacida]|uniref:adenylyl-sulfate reductase subunit alpha n=1 Tax=Mitsuokella multacida TaxID=52226 RepID=UPI0022E70547|nr:adenylyl-sulfate reductase subunit alpha [Mitsuokella multacida]